LCSTFPQGIASPQTTVQKEFGFSIIEMMEFASQKSCLEIEGWAGHRAVMFVPKHPAS
jgi:hypothetical protein